MCEGNRLVQHRTLLKKTLSSKFGQQNTSAGNIKAVKTGVTKNCKSNRRQSSAGGTGCAYSGSPQIYGIAEESVVKDKVVTQQIVPGAANVKVGNGASEVSSVGVVQFEGRKKSTSGYLAKGPSREKLPHKSRSLNKRDLQTNRDIQQTKANIEKMLASKQ